MQKKYYHIIFILLWTLIYPNIIKEIKITGNYKTSNKIILNQITQKINKPLNQEAIKEDIDILLTMGIFESIKIEHKNNIYFIYVQEKKTITFAPLIRKKEGIGWSVGPIMNINNINGKAKNIYFSTSLGAIKSGEIKYYNQKILIHYKHNTFSSIENNYDLTKKNLFINYEFKRKKYTINIIPQIINNNLQYHNKEIIYKYFSLEYNYLYKINNSNQYNISYKYNFSINNRENYSKLFINYKYESIKKSSYWIHFNTKIILNFKTNIPEYENLYIGGEDYVKGYYPNPADNPKNIPNNLVYQNLLLNSLQFEIPININTAMENKTRLLLFYDYAVSSNNYKKLNKQLNGYGLGISFLTINNIKLDFCIGLNPWGTKTIHFISHIN
tara:strand:- start:3028 stop:4185 length:1158 start_codon:yes stop_codon:yes gene_type:complete